MDSPEGRQEKTQLEKPKERQCFEDYAKRLLHVPNAEMRAEGDAREPKIGRV